MRTPSGPSMAPSSAPAAVPPVVTLVAGPAPGRAAVVSALMYVLECAQAARRERDQAERSPPAAVARNGD